MGKGSLPCDVLFISDAPHRSDDMTGLPFSGPDGRVLRSALKSAILLANISSDYITYYITHCVACRPCDDRTEPNRDPTGEEIWACFQRLEEEALLADPQHVVFLGKLAEKSCRQLFPAGIALQHPSYVYSQGGTNCAAYTQFIRELSEVFRKCTR